MAVLLLFYNCEEDYSKPAGTEVQIRALQRLITGDEAVKKRNELVVQLKKDGGKGVAKLRSTIAASVLKGGKPIDVTALIDKTEIYEIKQDNGNVNYTYRINHPDATDLVFYNVLEKSAPSGTKIELIQYAMEPAFAREYYDGTQDFARFSGVITVTAVATSSGFPCDDTPTVPAPITGGIGGGGAGGGNNGPATGPNPSPGVPINVYQQLVNAQFLALTMRASSGEGSGESNPPEGEEHYHNYYYRTAPTVNNSADPCDDGQDIGVLEPIYTSDEDNCEELVAKSSDTDFADKMSELTSKAGNQNFESAYTLYQNAGQGLLFSGEATGTPNVPEVSLNLSQSTTQATTNAIGFMHCHLDNGTTFKIFSFSDLIAMAQLATVSTRPSQELVIYLTTGSGTFALKVKDRTALKNNLLRMELAQVRYEQEFAEYVNVSQTMEEQILGFLNFIKERFSDTGLGVDLYHLNTDGNWDKLKLTSNGRRFTKTTCQ